VSRVPEARTIAEAYAYLELTLPAGESWLDHDRYTTLHSEGEHYVLRFDGPYEGRRISEEVRIPHAAHRAAEQAGQKFGPGRSALLDAGQWYALEAAYAGMAQTGVDRSAAGAEVDEQTYRAVVEAWEAAAAAAGEVARFLPPDADDVPSEAFWTEHGRRVRALRRDAFRRSRLADVQVFYERRADELRSGDPWADGPNDPAVSGARVPAPRTPPDVERLPTGPGGPAADAGAATGSGTGEPLPARTYGEAHVYMDLHPCGCGSGLFDRGRMRVLADDERGAVIRYAGPCEGCDRPREFTFWLPPRPGLPPGSPYLFSFPDDGPSRLLDPGDWAAVSVGYAWLPDAIADGALPPDEAALIDDDELVRLLTGAAGALDEVLKFFPPGVEALPPEACWTATGREFYQHDPERFHRVRVARLRDQRWERLAAFPAGYGR
jgi:hypothetical protein